jgi:hypothetical protein
MSEEATTETPETDAAIRSSMNEHCIVKISPFSSELVAHARMLERKNILMGREIERQRRLIHNLVYCSEILLPICEDTAGCDCIYCEAGRYIGYYPRKDGTAELKLWEEGS